MIPMIGSEKRKAGERPTFRASALAKYGGAVGTGVTVTIPATAQVGDFAVIGVSCRDDTRTVTAPAGLTKIYDTRDWPKSTNASGNSTQDGLAVYTKRIVAGDPGSTLTFKASGTGSEALIVAVGVYAGVDHIAVAPKGRTHYSGSWVSSTTPLSTLSVGPSNLIVGFIASMSDGNLDLSGPKLVSMGDSYTVRENDSVQVSILAAPIGLSLHDAPTHGWDEEIDVVVTKPNVVAWTHVAMELAGANTKGWFENERYPKTLQGKPIYCYGTSNTNMMPRADFDYSTLEIYSGEPKWTTQESYPDWLISIGDPDGLGNHMGVGGTTSTDNATFAFGSHVLPTQAVTADLLTDVSSIKQAGTWKAQTNRDMGGLVLLDIFGNDILGEYTPHSQVRDGATIAADSLIRLIRSSEVRGYNYNSGSETTTFTGTWQNQISDGADSGVYARTLTPGDYVEVVTSEPVVEILVIAVDSDNSTYPGAPFTVQVDGTTVHTDTTHNRMRSPAGSSSPAPTYNYVQMAIPLTLGAGTHTVRVTHTGAENTALRYAGYLIPKTDDDEIPYCVLMGMQVVDISPYSQTQEALTAYLDICANVAARFDSKVLVYDPMGNGQWAYRGLGDNHGPAGTADNALTLDGIHMNMKGHAFFATDLLRFLNENIP